MTDPNLLRDEVANLLDRLSAVAVELDSYPSPDAARDAVFGALNDFARALETDGTKQAARKGALSTSARADRMSQPSFRTGGDAFQGTSARIAPRFPLDMSASIAQKRAAGEPTGIAKGQAPPWPLDMSAELARKKRAEREAGKRRKR